MYWVLIRAYEFARSRQAWHSESSVPNQVLGALFNSAHIVSTVYVPTLTKHSNFVN